MFKIYLSRTVSPGVGISLPAAIKEMREACSLLNGNSDMVIEKQDDSFNYELVGKDYMKKHGGMFHAFGYTSGIQEELDPIYEGRECEPLSIQYRVPALWGCLMKCGSIEELNDLVSEHEESEGSSIGNVKEKSIK